MEISTLVESARDLSLLVAACVAAYSIDAWRREHVGRRRIDLAEEALALFYEARDAISHIRSPWAFGHEKLELERGPSESDDQFKARENASVVFYRDEQHRELFSRLRALRYRFIAQFGEEEAEPFDAIWESRNKVLSAARLLARYWPRDHFRTQQQYDEHLDRIGRQEAIFWEDLKDEDPIKPTVDAAVSDMERTCRGIIEGRGTLYGLLNRRIG